MTKESWISGITAFIIAAGGALGVVFVGEANPTGWQVGAAVLLGLVSGAKDVRALMKLPPIVPLLLLLGALAFGFTGCATTPQTSQRIQSAAKIAAYVGGAEYLRAHPETRPAFVLARDELLILSEAETLDFATLLSVVNRLPVKNLSNERTQMIVTVATITLSEYGEALPVDRLKELQPLAGALAAGLTLALEE